MGSAAADATRDDSRCAVCGEAVDDANSTDCGVCRRRFHLVMTEERAGKDCGEVWIDEELLALQFACARCLAQDRENADGEDAPARPPRRSGGRAKRTGLRARDVVRRRRP